MTIGEAREMSDRRKSLLRQHADVSHIYVMKECEFMALKKENEKVAELCKQFRKTADCEQIDLRSCFRGGIVDSYSLYFSVEKLKKLLKKLYPDSDLSSIRGLLLDYNSQVRKKYLLLT